MDKVIQKLQGHSFSSTELLELVEGKANFITYPQLAKYSHIDELLKNNDALIILYLTKPNYGHYTCLFRRCDDPSTLEFFDPLGIPMDDELEWIPKDFRRKSNQDYPYLTKLVYESGYNLIYNKYPLQKMMTNNNVCGRFVGLRIILKYLTIDQFVDLFIKNKHYSSDWLASALTVFIA